MKNSPTVRQISSVQLGEPSQKLPQPPPAEAKMYEPPYAAYLGQVLLAVCILTAGVITGLEQGRKPLFLTMKDKAAQEEMAKKMKAIEDGLEAGFPERSKFKDFEMVEAPDTLEIRFGISKVFAVGLASMSVENQRAIHKMAGLIHDAAKDSSVEIESYTDDTPMQKGSWLYPSNWELSGARAARILREFLSAGYSEKNLKFVGWGETHPLVPNRDGEGRPILANQERNRRVVIRIKMDAPTK